MREQRPLRWPFLCDDGETGMQPFSAKSRCPKCHGRQITARYCNGALLSDLRCPDRLDEHIHRTCRRCVYGWIESCLDAA